MKKTVLTSMALALTVAMQAAEEPFEAGQELIYSTINTTGTERGLSIYKRKQVIFFRNDTAYVAAVSFNSDLDPFWIATEIEELPLDEQFAYDIYTDKLIFSSEGSLYQSFWRDNKWTFRTHVKMEGVNARMKHPYNDSISEPKKIQRIFHPTLAKKGDRLYFAAQSKGRTDLDIWYSDRTPDDTWMAPHRLPCNTAFNEDHPFVVGDSLLYFSSNRSENRRANLYYVDLNDTESKARISVLSQPNSDEIGIVVVDNRVHVISNRCPGGDGTCDDNIYKLEIVPRAKPHTPITFQDIPESIPQGEDPIEAMPYIFRTLTESEAAEALKRGDSLRADHIVATQHQGSISPEQMAKTDSLLKAALTANEENLTATQVTKNIARTRDKIIFYFDLDNDQLGAQYDEDLTTLARTMNEDSESSFLICGFTDERGPADHNQDLSVRRAQTVFQALIDRGINSSRLMFTGFGERGLVIKNAQTEEQHAKNRRVEIRKIR